MESLPTFKTMGEHFGEIGDAALKFIQKSARPLTFLKGETLVEPGKTCQHLYFIQKGVVRGFIAEGRKETTTWLTSEGEMATAIRSFLMQVPTQEKVEAIEDCKVLELSYENLQKMLHQFVKLNVVGLKIMEQYYCDAEERAYVIRLSNANLKYQYFLKTKGNLINRIPLKYIASYLGMTTETLSRIRTKFSQSK